MATTVEFHPNVGSVWQRALALWDQYAQGTYTAWAQAFNNSYDNKAWDITVTNPDTSEDVYTLIAGDQDIGGYGSLQGLANDPGFHATLSKVYPETLPDGHTSYSRYGVGPWNLRGSIWSHVAGASQDLINLDDTGNRYGVQTRFIFCAYFKDLNMVVDCTGIIWGTPTVDEWVGYPTNFVNNSPIAIGGGGGGGSVDLTPIVGPLQDIALRDVSYSFNNGATIFNCNGKVNV